MDTWSLKAALTYQLLTLGAPSRILKFCIANFWWIQALRSLKEKSKEKGGKEEVKMM